MNYRTPKPPPAVTRAFAVGLGNYVDPSNPVWQVLLNKYVALEWCSLDLNKVGQLPEAPDTIARDIDPAKSNVIETGWRFVAADGDYYGGCHVGKVDLASPPILTGFSDDVEILTFTQNLEQLKQMPEGGARQYELRVLRIPWLHFDAFWIQIPTPPAGTQAPTAEAVDYVVPCGGFVEGPPNHLEVMYPYPVKDFLTAIWPCVQRAYSYHIDSKKLRSAALGMTSAFKARYAADEQSKSAERIDAALERKRPGAVEAKPAEEAPAAKPSDKP